MKTHYEISINYNDLFRNESLLQVLSNLEKLDQITEDIFTRINKNILEKKTKLENLKSRINRASSIISSFETLPQALTIKSKRFYPSINSSSNADSNDPLDISPNPTSSLSLSTKNNLFYKSIYYDDVCDFNLLKNNPLSSTPFIEINSKPSNHLNKLGKKPDGSLEDVTLCQEILNSQHQFKEIKSDMTLGRCVTNLFDKSEISSDIDNVNSLFQFMDKTKVFGEKMSQGNFESRESNLLNNFMSKKQVQKKIKKPQEAPVTITEKVKLTQFKQKKDVIRRNTTNNVQLNIPMNLNLPLISDFDIETTPQEDYFIDDKINDIYAPQGTIYGDDINDYSTPMEIIKNYKAKQSILVANSNIGNVGNNNQQPGNTNNNNNSTVNTNTQVSNNSHSSSSNLNTVSNTNITNNISNSNTENNQINNPNTNTNTNQTQQTIPVPNTTQNINKPVLNTKTTQANPNASKIPPVPKVPLPPKMPPKKVIKPPTKTEVVNIQEIKTEGAKKQEIKTTTPSLSIQEQIGENPMDRLKKRGTIDVPAMKIDEKKIPDQASMYDSLKNQISMRFNNLNKNNKPVKSKKKKKGSDSDSFSSKSESD